MNFVLRFFTSAGDYDRAAVWATMIGDDKLIGFMLSMVGAALSVNNDYHTVA